MNRRSCSWILAATLLLLLLLAAAAILWFWPVIRQTNFTGLLSSGDLANVEAPLGFQANVYAEGLSEPRFIAFGPDGALYVAERGAGRITRLPDDNRDGRADTLQSFAEELDEPHSLVFHQGAWYVGVPSGVVRLVDENGDGTAEIQEAIVDDLPPGSHATKTVEFLPDGRMVVSIGSSCNACQEEDPRRAAIIVYDDASGSNPQLFATGLRNAVGLAIHPQTGELWATNNGRDLMGDDLPPETVYILNEGADYGWPACHSGDVPDPELGGPTACEGVAQPLITMQAHTAPLGLTFYTGNSTGDSTGDSFPADYAGDLFIALHGSWNRSVPVGYKVVRLPLDGSRPAGPLEDFATGWLNEETGQVRGRPVGLAIGPDGALYISDDKAGYIYRISSNQE
jgi:glucose/arabinose dehydrogenase